VGGIDLEKSTVFSSVNFRILSPNNVVDGTAAPSHHLTM
jgi:hypothetical protein